MKCRRMTSIGSPFFSYMASRKKGSMRQIMSIVDALVPIRSFVRKKGGTPTSAPRPKHTTCRLVRLNRNLLLTFVRSFGIGT